MYYSRAMASTFRTEEQYTIQQLILCRGGNFTLALFKGTGIGMKDIGDVYNGHPVSDSTFRVIQRVLKERMTSD